MIRFLSFALVAAFAVLKLTSVARVLGDAELFGHFLLCAEKDLSFLFDASSDAKRPAMLSCLKQLRS
jgi:hypothetical protein